MERGEITAIEAGRIGGIKTRELGPDHFRRIGEKGQESRRRKKAELLAKLGSEEAVREHQRQLAREKADRKSANSTKEPVTVRQAGIKGGYTLKEMYGIEFFAANGRLGGAEIAKRGPEFFSEIGRMGGEATSLAHQSEGHHVEAGKKGGDVTKEKHGSEHYSRISKLARRGRNRFPTTTT